MAVIDLRSDTVTHPTDSRDRDAPGDGRSRSR